MTGVWLKFRPLQNDEKQNKGCRILVVDDDPAVCEAIKMLLQHDGHTVQTIASGKEALALLESINFDVVITDYSMAEMKGDKLAAAVKQRLPHLPVIMITAHADVLQSSGNPLSGVDFLLNKPFLLADLRESIAAVLAQDQPLNIEELKSRRRPDVGGSL